MAADGLTHSSKGRFRSANPWLSPIPIPSVLFHSFYGTRSSPRYCHAVSRPEQSPKQKPGFLFSLSYRPAARTWGWAEQTGQGWRSSCLRGTENKEPLQNRGSQIRNTMCHGLGLRNPSEVHVSNAWFPSGGAILGGCCETFRVWALPGERRSPRAGLGRLEAGSHFLFFTV